LTSSGILTLMVATGPPLVHAGVEILE